MAIKGTARTERLCVVDDNGNQRYSAQTGQPMTLPDLLTEMKADKIWGRAFYAVETSGAGLKEQLPPSSFEGKYTMTAEQSKDFRAYKVLADEAEKTGQQVTITGIH